MPRRFTQGQGLHLSTDGTWNSHLENRTARMPLRTFGWRAVTLVLTALVLVPLLFPAHSDARTLEDSTSRMSRLLRHIITPQTTEVSDAAYNSKPEEFVQMQEYQTTLAFQVAAAPAPAPPPPRPPSNVTCPPTPNECDFYFQGSESTVPTLSLATKADSPISPPIVTSVQGSSIQVYVFNTANAEYICSDGPPPPPDNQFYTNGVYIQARVFQTGYLNYVNRYVRMNITSVQINAFGMVINLNPGQANNFFPESRRCIIFKTAV